MCIRDRDNRKSFPEAGEFSKISGIGNFVELLNFAIRRGDDQLKNHYIINHAKNASYFSKGTQNEFIDICGALILEKIILSIKSNDNVNYFFLFWQMKQWTVLKKSNFL